MAPLDAAFAESWPDAPRFNLLDESLYAEMDADGTITPAIRRKTAVLFDYCVEAGATAILFTGSTFGPAVEEARSKLAIPVLKPDEAMADDAVRNGGRIAVLCTAKRALPVVSATLQAAADAAGRRIEIDMVFVPDAQGMLAAGDVLGHQQRIVATAESAARHCDVIVLGQISMSPAMSAVTARMSRPVYTSPSSAVERLRRLTSGMGTGS